MRVLDVRKRPLEAGLSPEMLEAITRALSARRPGAGVQEPPRLRAGPALPRLRLERAVQALQHLSRGVPMTVHAGGRRLQCHHCGARQGVPSPVRIAASLALQPQGAGTERIEEACSPRVSPTCRCCASIAAARGASDALERLFESLGTRPGILVGTQMLAKGHDLPNLTLVAVVGIDEGLFSADFRAGEKTRAAADPGRRPRRPRRQARRGAAADASPRASAAATAARRRLCRVRRGGTGAARSGGLSAVRAPGLAARRSQARRRADGVSACGEEGLCRFRRAAKEDLLP